MLFSPSQQKKIRDTWEDREAAIKLSIALLRLEFELPTGQNGSCYSKRFRATCEEELTETLKGSPSPEDFFYRMKTAVRL